MKVLWLCNVIMPMIAEQLNLEVTNKEGWITGLAEVVLKNAQENNLELSVAFPAPRVMFPENHDICRRVIALENTSLTCYGFYEETGHAEIYNQTLEKKLRKILDAVNPDIVHCFGTEYPHTLAMARIIPDKGRLLIGLQGICAMCAEAYFANLPNKAVKKVTLRDYLRRDSMIEQQQKFVRRGVMEKEAITLAGNITGRTEWDRLCTRKWNQTARYFNMNEILRPEFYGAKWQAEQCIPHSIFMSQGDYPIKGLHYMLQAMPAILAKYPDATLYVAGNSIVNYATLKQKLKISGYGKYLRKLMKENGLLDKVRFLGKLSSEQMRDRYLRSSVYVCCSSLENSPNSLGEAMLLGMPCVSADVGGIPSLFFDGEDGILYEGYRIGRKVKNNTKNFSDESDAQMKAVAKRLAGAVIRMWSDPEKQKEYCQNASVHANRTHKRERNYQKLMEIYARILSGDEGDHPEENMTGNDRPEDEKGIS